jgi:fibronectin-binding autotransporter adhesin
VIPRFSLFQPTQVPPQLEPIKAQPRAHRGDRDAVNVPGMTHRPALRVWAKVAAGLLLGAGGATAAVTLLDATAFPRVAAVFNPFVLPASGSARPAGRASFHDEDRPSASAPTAAYALGSTSAFSPQRNWRDDHAPRATFTQPRSAAPGVGVPRSQLRSSVEPARVDSRQSGSPSAPQVTQLEIDTAYGNSPYAVTDTTNSGGNYNQVIVGRVAGGELDQSGGTLGTSSLLLGYAGAGGVYNLSGGMLSVSSLADIGTGGTGTFNASGGTFVVTGQLIVADSGNGTLNQTGGTIDASNASTVIGNYSTGVFNLSGTSSLFKTSGLTLASSQGTGMVYLNGGTLQTGSVTGGSGASTFNLNGGTLQASGNSTTFFQGLTTANVQAGGAIIDTQGYSITVAQNLLNYTGTGTVDGGLSKLGPGTLTLTGTNTYTGPTTINAGTLSIGTIANGGTASPLGASSNASGNLVLNGGTLAYTGGAATTGRGLSVNAPGGALDVTTALTITGIVTSNGGGLLTVAGPGTLTLGGSTDNAGLGINVTGGTLVLAKASSSSVHAIGGGGLTINGGTVQLAGTGGDQIYDSAPVAFGTDGGTFDLNGTSETIAGLSGTAGTITNTSAAATSTLTVTGSGTFAGTFGTSGNGLALTVAGSGQTLTLAGSTDNSYLSATVNAGTLILAKTSSSGVHAVGGGLTINGGTVQLAGTGGDQIYDASGVTFGTNGGTFDLNGTSETIGSLNGPGGTVTNTAGTASTLTVGSSSIAGSGTGTYSGVLSDGSSGLALVKAGTGTFTLTAVNTFTGGTTADAGTLVLGDGTHAAALIGYEGGSDDVGFYGGSGGTAVTINNGAMFHVLANSSVTGGDGGGNEGGGTGGTSVIFTGGGMLINSGTINGGSGGIGAIANGGLGGSGVSFTSGGMLINAGAINGGVGGASFNANSGTTGSGVNFSGGIGILTNQNGGAISGGVVMDSAYANAVTLQIGSTITGGLNIGTNTGSTLTLTDNGTGGSQTYSAAVDSTTFAGALIKNGTGTWTLDQALNYTGSTTINAGTLSVGSIANGGAASPLGASTNDSANLVLNGGRLAYTGGTATSDRGLTVAAGNGAVNVTTAASNLTLTGAVIGNSGGALTASGTGTLTLAGNTDNAGLSVDVTGGTLALAKSSSGSVHAVGGTGGVAIDGGTLQLAGTGGDQIYDSAAVTINSGTFDLNGRTETISVLNGSASGTVTNTAATGATLTVGTDGFTGLGGGTFAGVITDGSTSGTTALVKTGAGTLTLTGFSTYTGGTTITGGTLLVSGNNGTLGSGPLSLNNLNTGAGTAVTLDVSSPQNTIVGSLSGSLGTPSSGTNTVAINDSGKALSITQTVDGTFPGTITTGDFTLGAGSTATLTLTGASNLGGTTHVAGGTLAVTGSVATSNLNVNNSAALAISGSGSIKVTNNLQVLNGTLTLGDSGIVLTDVASLNMGSITQNGGTFIATDGLGINPGATYNLNGGTLSVPYQSSNGASATFNFNGGTLQPTADSTSFTQGQTTFNVQTGGARIDTNGYNITIAQPLLHDTTSNAPATDGGLTKVAPGILTLTAASTYTGGTTITGGTLLANNTSGSATGTGQVNVQPGAILGGNGTIDGPVLVQGGTLAPGVQTISKLTINGALTFQPDSLLSITLGGTTAGTYDQIVVVGTLALYDPHLQVNTANGFTLAPGMTFTILDHPGDTPTFGMFTNTTLAGTLYTDAAGDTFAIDYLAIADGDLIPNDVTLTVESVVPEPSTWAMLGVGLALGLIVQRPRRVAV